MSFNSLVALEIGKDVLADLPEVIARKVFAILISKV